MDKPSTATKSKAKKEGKKTNEQQQQQQQQQEQQQKPDVRTSLQTLADIINNSKSSDKLGELIQQYLSGLAADDVIHEYVRQAVRERARNESTMYGRRRDGDDVEAMTSSASCDTLARIVEELDKMTVCGVTPATSVSDAEDDDDGDATRVPPDEDDDADEVPTTSASTKQLFPATKTFLKSRKTREEKFGLCLSEDPVSDKERSELDEMLAEVAAFRREMRQRRREERRQRRILKLQIEERYGRLSRKDDSGKDSQKDRTRTSLVKTQQTVRTIDTGCDPRSDMTLVKRSKKSMKRGKTRRGGRATLWCDDSMTSSSSSSSSTISWSASCEEEEDIEREAQALMKMRKGEKLCGDDADPMKVERKRHKSGKNSRRRSSENDAKKNEKNESSKSKQTSEKTGIFMMHDSDSSDSN